MIIRGSLGSSFTLCLLPSSNACMLAVPSLAETPAHKGRLVYQRHSSDAHSYGLMPKRVQLLLLHRYKHLYPFWLPRFNLFTAFHADNHGLSPWGFADRLCMNRFWSRRRYPISTFHVRVVTRAIRPLWASLPSDEMSASQELLTKLGHLGCSL